LCSHTQVHNQISHASHVMATTLDAVTDDKIMSPNYSLIKNYKRQFILIGMKIFNMNLQPTILQFPLQRNVCRPTGKQLKSLITHFLTSLNNSLVEVTQ
jgi:hypothetical protein